MDKKCTKEEIVGQFLMGFDLSGQGVRMVSKSEWMQYYKDLSMTMVDDNYFVGMLEAIWGVAEDASTTVTKNEMEHMVRSIRHKLLDLSVGDRSDEYVLRQVFREFDTNKDGVLGPVEFDAMLRRIQIRVPAPYVEALMKKFDRNGNGVVEFEEMLSFLTHNPYK